MAAACAKIEGLRPAQFYTTRVSPAPRRIYAGGCERGEARAMAEEEIFKPPLAEGALAVSVTSGCSYNGCAFCTMYRGAPFRALPLDAARAELTAAKKIYPHVGRVFLEEGDAFALPAARLPKSRASCMNFTRTPQSHASPRYTT